MCFGIFVACWVLMGVLCFRSRQSGVCSEMLHDYDAAKDGGSANAIQYY